MQVFLPLQNFVPDFVVLTSSIAVKKKSKKDPELTKDVNMKIGEDGVVLMSYSEKKGDKEICSHVVKMPSANLAVLQTLIEV